MNPTDAFAEALADRRPVDWEAALRDAATPDEREAIEALRDLSVLGDAFAGELALPAHHAEGRPLLAVGTEWGGLRVVASIGRGRFGDVYRAWDLALEREVALKLIHETADATGSRVIDEGRLMARVRHPNVVTIHGAQRIDGVVGLSMEFIEGGTLDAELAERGPFDVADLARVATDLAGALGAVHQAGLVHRDVKATNVIRETAGRIVLGDFGTGRVIDGADEAPGFAGTPAYIAPEIFQGRPATAQSDLYSLGVLLFYLATRDYPVKGRTLRELRTAHASADRARLPALRPDLPARFVQVIDRLLEPDPTKRFSTAAAVSDAVAPPSRRNWARGWRAAAACLALAVIVGAGTWLSWSSDERLAAGAPDAPNVQPIDRAALISLPAAVAATTSAPTPPIESGSEVPKQSPAPPGLVIFPERDNLVFRGAAANGIIACQHDRGNVAVCDLGTGAPRILREYENETSFAPLGRSLLLSPEGSRVAYAWLTGSAKTRENSVNLIPAAGGASLELYRAKPGSVPLMHRWLADGSALLMSEPDGDGRRVFLLPADGRPHIDIWRLGPGFGSLFDLSPDWRYLVASIDGTAGSSRVVIIDRETTQEAVVFGERGWFPLWTPSADAVVFESTQQGGSVVMRVPIRDGAPAGTPEIAWRFGRAVVRPIAFGMDGSLFLMHSPPVRTAFRVEVDLPQARVGKPQLVDPLDVEDTIGADWSPDGRQIAYLRGRMWMGPRGPRGTVVVRNVNGGVVNEIELPGTALPGVSQARWSPDGKRLAVVYSGKEVNDTAIDVIDLESRTRHRILEGPPYASPRWDSTGEWLYYKQNAAIMRRHLANSTTEEVYRAAKMGIRTGDGFDLNRADGALALLVQQPGAPGCVVRIVEASGAVIQRQIFEPPVANECVAVAWTRDGATLLVSTNASPTDSSLWRVDRAGGDPVRLPLNERMYHVLSHGPGGLLYSTGNERFSMAMLAGMSGGR